MSHKKNTATWDHLVLGQRTVHTPVVPKGIIILQIYTAVLNDRQPQVIEILECAFKRHGTVYLFLEQNLHHEYIQQIWALKIPL